MVRHPETLDDLARLPLIHQRVERREPFTDEDIAHINDRDEEGNTALHRVVARLNGENPAWDPSRMKQPFMQRPKGLEMFREANPGSDDARTITELVLYGADVDVRNADGHTALDLARERYARIAQTHESGAAAVARVGGVTNLLNDWSAQPGPRVDSGASEEAVLSDPMLLRDQVYLDDREGLKQTWSTLRSPVHDDPDTGTKQWLVYDTNSSTMMGLLANELGVSLNDFPKSYSSWPASNNPEELRNTPLQLAVKQGDVDRVKTLLEHGAVTGRLHGLNAELPLAMAINRQDLPMIDALLDAGAETDRWVMRNQFSALAVALDTKCPEPIIASLLQHGADPNGHGLSIPPLGRVTDEHDLAIVDTLLDYGARTNPAGEETPQFMAALNGHVEVCKRITERIGDAAGIDTLSRSGYTALALLVDGIDEQDDAIARRLLDAGASPQKAMESPIWQDAMRHNQGQGTEMTAIIARRREGEVLREAIVEAQQEVVQEEEQPAPARARRRL